MRPSFTSNSRRLELRWKSALKTGVRFRIRVRDRPALISIEFDFLLDYEPFCDERCIYTPALVGYGSQFVEGVAYH
jgi:hypothetical protein